MGHEEHEEHEDTKKTTDSFCWRTLSTAFMHGRGETAFSGIQITGSVEGPRRHETTKNNAFF